MPVSADIYQNLLRPPRSIADYDQEAQTSQINALNIRSAMQKQAAEERGIADQNALREVYKGFGNDAVANRNKLYQAGLGKEALGYEKAQGDIAKDQAAAGKDKAQTTGYNLDNDAKKLGAHLQQMTAIRSPEQYPQWVQQGVQSGALSPQVGQRFMSAFQQTQGNPQAFAKLMQDTAMSGIDTYKRLEMQTKATQDARDFGLKNANETMTQGADGSYGINQPLVDAKKHIAKAGASNVSVKVDTKLGEGVAKEVGPMMRDSYEAATGAQASIQTADQLIKAIDSGKTITGPAATLRLKGAQVAETLGIAGKDTVEKIANTRAAIQGLAQTTLTARKQLAGQGQVSDNEGRLLERASSGNIDDLTTAEIKQIAEVNKRLAQRQVTLHGQRVQKLRSNQSTEPMATFYDLGTEPNAAAGSGFKYLGKVE